MSYKTEHWQAVKEGLVRGWHGYLWLMKIVVPVSAAVALIEYSGWLYRLDSVLSPVLGLLGLSASAAVPLLVGLLSGIYGGIAAMTALSLSPVEQTLIAVFLLNSHNLIQEGIIQDRSGLAFWKATATRLVASATVVLVVAWLLNSAPAGGQTAAAVVFREPFGEFAVAWAASIGVLAVKMFVILMPLMVILEIMKATGGIEALVRLTAPLLRLLGLKRQVGVLWLTGAVFGLSYGSAVIVEEARNGSFSGRDLEELQVSVGINHAMIEDPLLFMAIGVSPLWLWLPRLAAALAAVYMLRTIETLRRRLSGFSPTLR
jgi:spore maturation protein SpmB